MKKERERERLTLASPAGKGGIILNPVGRLSNLYLFIRKGAPTGANGRFGCFKFVVSCSDVGVLALGLWDKTLSTDFILSPTISVCGDTTAEPGSLEDLGVAALAISPAISTLGLLATCSATTSPLVACKRDQNLRISDGKN